MVTLRNRQQGMNLVSLMVGLTISLLVVMVAAGSAGFMENMRRGGVAGDAALQDVSIALQDLQREVANAGVGLFADGRQVCSSINIYNADADPPVMADSAAISPVVIDVGAVAGSDDVTLFSFEGILGAAPYYLTESMKDNQPHKHVLNRTAGLARGDLVLVAPRDGVAPCTLKQVDPAPKDFEVLTTPGNNSPWNPPPSAGKSPFDEMVTYPEGSYLFRAGVPRWVTYRVRDGQFQMLNRVTGEVQVLAYGAVALAATYGVRGADGNTLVWQDDVTAAEASRVRAVRVAVTLRSAERAVECSKAENPPDVWPGRALDADESVWRCANLRTLTAVMPLTNVLFSGD